MKRLILSLLTLIPFVTIHAQELTEVMKIELQDTVLTFKVSDIKSFSFDEIEWVEPEMPEEPSPEEPETPEPTYELRILTFEDEDAKFTPYSLDYAGVEITTWSDLIDAPNMEVPFAMATI